MGQACSLANSQPGRRPPEKKPNLLRRIRSGEVHASMPCFNFPLPLSPPGHRPERVQVLLRPALFRSLLIFDFLASKQSIQN
jgi:hypothetical protein